MAGLTVLLVVVWIASAWWDISSRNTDGGVIGLASGRLLVVRPMAGESAGVYGNPQFARPRAALEWWYLWQRSPFHLACAIPLWPAALLSLLATAAAWRADAKYLRRARMGLCAGCGYDRAGLAAGSLCPECGKQPEAR